MHAFSHSPISVVTSRGRRFEAYQSCRNKAVQRITRISWYGSSIFGCRQKYCFLFDKTKMRDAFTHGIS
jgi:hypothetical protein